MDELKRLEIELEEALSAVDGLVDTIAQMIIDIAYSNKYFICTQCIKTAKELYQLMKLYAREDYCASVAAQYEEITGRDIDE
ncbi:MAG: hypothetical protein IJ446_09115 [Oscillospiraceae bacterium]|nr:hypothetical protein [Oscillospiraceae bacterium]